MFDVNYTRDLERLLAALELERWRERGFADRTRVQQDPATAKALLSELEQLLSQRTANEWQEALSLIGLCASVCHTNQEWLQHPHAIESATVIEVDDPVLGPMRQPEIKVQLSGTPGRVRGPAPLPDIDRVEVLDSLEGERTPAPARQPDLVPPLDGVKVLDLCIVLAGPTSGRTLAEFGADVIKIDDPNREGRDAYQLDVNRGKRSVLLDLRCAEDLELFWRLASQADVIVEGFRKGVVGRLGIGYEAVRERVPEVIYASINCYGESGPWSERPGYEQLAQAATGMQERYGDGTPRLQSMPINDYGTGYSAAFAIALALHHRRRTGRGQHVSTALSRTATTLQSLYLHDYPGRDWSRVPRGPQSRGECAGQMIYQGSDGWFFLGTSPANFERLLRLGDFEGLKNSSQERFQVEFEARLAARPIAYWSDLARRVDVGIQALCSVDQAMTDPVAIAHGVSLTREHETIGLVRTNGPSRGLWSNRPTTPGRPAPIQGSDGDEIRRRFWGAAAQGSR